MNGVIGIRPAAEQRTETAAKEFAKRCARNGAENLLGLINDILDFFQIEASATGIEPISFDLRAGGRKISPISNVAGSRKKAST